MSFSPEELRLLEISDQVEEQLEPQQRKMLHWSDSVQRRIARIGLTEFRRIKAEIARRSAARRRERERQAANHQETT